MTPNSKIAALAALILASGSALAGTAPMPAPAPMTPAPVGGTYLDISAGPLWISDIASIGFDSGWGVNGEIGYALGNGLSFGFNAGYNTADLDVEDLDLPSSVHVTSSSKIETIPLMATVNYTFTISGPLTGYIGLGAGVLWANGDTTVSYHGKDYGASLDDWNFALQARAGLSYAVSSSASINVGYRYLHGFLDADQYQGQMVEGGVTFRF